MPLDDREQQILAEIERQFYEEDPDLAHAVRNISERGLSRWTGRLAVAGIAVGIVILLATFRYNTFVALFGFLLIVISTTAVLRGYRRREGGADLVGDSRRQWSSWTAKSRFGRRFRPPS
ncbi:MAG: DUF3040 domain-containing protein [Acidimicrobiia bacterium]|nr:DUF3040 domain-containing protein [Acidimicrobiia bacterium]